jgi:UrcA family protein
MKTISLTGIALLSLLAVGAAHADDVIVPASIVKYGDLDLTRSAGEAALYSRIHQAARKVCAPLDVSQSVAPLSMAEAYKSCLAKAVSGAAAKIDNPQFTAYVVGKISPVTIKLASR